MMHQIWPDILNAATRPTQTSSLQSRPRVLAVQPFVPAFSVVELRHRYFQVLGHAAVARPSVGNVWRSQHGKTTQRFHSIHP